MVVPGVIDACVLAEAAVSDLLLRLSEAPGLLTPRWSEDIWRETKRTWIYKLGWDQSLAERRVAAAVEAFPEAMVQGFEHLIPLCKNHPEDRHVLAAAIHGGAKLIVTFNIADFREDALKPWRIAVVHPSDFLKDAFDQDPESVTEALAAMAAKTNRDIDGILGRLAWYVKPFSEHVATQLELRLPSISPQDWRR